MFTKRNLMLVLSLLAMFSMVLAACAPKATEEVPPPPTAAPEEEPTEALPPTAEPEEEDEVVEIEPTDTPAPEAEELEGTIVISISSNDTRTYQALADAYMELHPKVEVLVELKAPGVGGEEDAYLQWVRAQFAAGTPRVSILESVHLRDLIQEGVILNLGPYLAEVNPYSGNVWEDDFQEWGLNFVRDESTGEMWYLPYMSVQTFWVYNKRIFEEAGITEVPEQPTWDQFVEWCGMIKAAGYIPIAMEGTTQQIWGGGRMPWLLRSAMDQYHRDDINLVRCQEGDWCFREGIDDVWAYDPTDPHNDDGDQVSINVVRHLQALRDGEIRFDTPEMVDMLEQLARVFRTENGFVPEGWAGLADAYPLFLTQKAAMRQFHGGFFTSFPKDIARLAEGAYYTAPEGEEEPTPSAEELAATEFEYGVFAFPTINTPLVQGNARANELTQGYLTIPKKDRAQNDLEVDFLMFWASPVGMSIYLENKLDPDNLQGGIAGPPIIKGVELPPDVDVFGNTTFIGSYEKPGAPGDKVARGFYFYEPTKREWAIMMQQFFAGDITAEEFAGRYQQLLEDNWDGLLEYLNMTEADVDNPDKQPPGWVAGGPY
jgi:ABC-type glycerol-3-phosphate transport system substrate-binding protein